MHRVQDPRQLIAWGGKGGWILDSNKEYLPHCNVIRIICHFSKMQKVPPI